jgi:hypothetical protein
LGILNSIKKFFLPKQSKQKVIIKELKNLDYENGKEFAYRFTILARELELTDREKRLFDDIFDDLRQYKYKQKSTNLNNSSIVKIEVFLGALD